MDVRLPNGTVIQNVPDNYSAEDLADFAIKKGLMTQEEYSQSVEDSEKPSEKVPTLTPSTPAKVPPQELTPEVIDQSSTSVEPVVDPVEPIAEPPAVPEQPPAVTTEPTVDPVEPTVDPVEPAKKSVLERRAEELFAKADNNTITPFERLELANLQQTLGRARAASSVARTGAATVAEIAKTPFEIGESVLTVISPEVANDLRNSPFGQAVKKLDDILESSLSEEEKLVRNIIAVSTIAGIGKKLATKGLDYIARKKGKQFSDKIKRQAALGGATVGTVQGFVQTTDFGEDDQALLITLATDPDIDFGLLPESAVEEIKKFRVNPNDPTRKNELLKYFGAIADTAFGTAVFKGLGFVGKKIITKQTIARLNTAAGRLLRSDANLPQRLAEAQRGRTRAAVGNEIRIKKDIKDLERSIKDNDVDEDILNEYINAGAKAKDRPSYINRGVPESVLDQVDNLKKKINNNEALINNQLGLTGDARIGLNRDQGGFYLTRTFESANNPKYYAEIKKALLDESPDPVFLTKVENARSYMKKMGVKSADVDDVISAMVFRLSKEDKPFIDKIFDGTALAGASPSSVKVLRRKKEIEEPILDLLGASRSGKETIARTLTEQTKLIAELKYLKDLEKFARENIGKDVNLKGLLPLLPSVKAPFAKGNAPNIEFDLEQVARNSIGKFGGDSRQILKDLYTSPEMGRAINQGLELFNNSGRIRSIWVNAASLAQAKETLLDLPAYALNLIGGTQSLIANGHLANPVAYKAAVKEIGTLANQLTLKNPEAVEKLAKLRSLNVIEQDVTGELIKAGAAQMQNATGVVGRTYRKTMNKLGSLYGQPDAYLKLISFASERAALKKIFKEEPAIKGIMNARNVSRKEAKKIYDNDLDERAARYVRDTMPTYSAAAPIAREIAKTPIIGNYVLFPSEVIRNTKNILKTSLRDMGQGVKQGNPALFVHGGRRFLSAGVVAGGWDMVANQTEEGYKIPEANKKFTNAVSPDWTKGSKQFWLQPFVKDNNQKNPRIISRYIGSTTADTFDLLKSPIRLIQAKVGTNGFVTDSEIDDAFSNATKGLIGSYISPKFLTEALVNVVSGTNLKTGKPIYDEAVGATTKDKIITAVREVGKYLEPGTLKAIEQHIESVSSEELLGEGQGQRASGFPLNSKDLEFYVKTGIRPVTIDVEKSMGYDMSSRLKAIAKTKDNFLAEVRKLPRREITNEDVDNLLNSYRDLQERKYKGMQNFTKRLNEFKNVSYYEIPKGKTEVDFTKEPTKLDAAGVLAAATDQFWYNPNDKLILPLVANVISEVENGVFIPDNLIGDQSIFKALEDRQVSPEVSDRLRQGLTDIFSEYIQKPLVEVEN